jgi:hypothetical protein
MGQVDVIPDVSTAGQAERPTQKIPNRTNPSTTLTPYMIHFNRTSTSPTKSFQG